MTQTLWTAEELQAITGGTLSAGGWSITGLEIDSRKTGPGDLFLAFEGEQVDGHAYLDAASQAGAAAALVSKQVEARLPTLLVSDVLEALEKIAVASRARSKARIAALTGSVGKTGSKEMLAACLRALAPNAHASAGNLNNHIGAPLSLARMDEASALAVFELGMNHPDEIRPLTKMVRPHVALITNVELVHAGHFKYAGEIATAKSEIFDGVELGGTAVLNADNPYTPYLRERASASGIEKFLTFGRDEGSDIRLLDLKVTSNSTEVSADVLGQRMSWSVGGVGDHWGLNSLGVVGVLAALELDLEACLPALSKVSAMRGRGGQVVIDVPGGSFLLIDESYNASPPAVEAALKVFAASETSGRRILVLGDMLELGHTSKAAHEGLKAAVEASGADAVWLIGPEMKALRDELPSALVAGWAETSETLAQEIANSVRAGDTLLVKGSLGMKMKHVVNALEALSPPVSAAGAGG